MQFIVILVVAFIYLAFCSVKWVRSHILAIEEHCYQIRFRIACLEATSQGDPAFPPPSHPGTVEEYRAAIQQEEREHGTRREWIEKMHKELGIK